MNVENFLVVNSKMFILYYLNKTTTKPYSSTAAELLSVRRGGELQKITEKEHRIKIINLSFESQEYPVMADFIAKRQSHIDEGNHERRKLLLRGNEVVFLQSISSYLAIDWETLSKHTKIIPPIPFTKDINYIKDTIADENNIHVLFHQGPGSIRHVMSLGPTVQPVIHPSVDSIGDYSQHLAISHQYILTIGGEKLGQGITNMGNRNIALRMTSLEEETEKKSLVFPFNAYQFYVKSLCVLGDDAYVFGLNREKKQTQLWKINLKTGTGSNEVFNSISDFSDCNHIQLTANGFYVLSDGSLKFYSDESNRQVVPGC